MCKLLHACEPPSLFGVPCAATMLSHHAHPRHILSHQPFVQTRPRTRVSGMYLSRAVLLSVAPNGYLLSNDNHNFLQCHRGQTIYTVFPRNILVPHGCSNHRFVHTLSIIAHHGDECTHLSHDSAHSSHRSFAGRLWHNNNNGDLTTRTAAKTTSTNVRLRVQS